MYNHTRPVSGKGAVLDERTAVLRAQQGEPEAFELLVKQYQDVAFRAAYLIARNEADAQDVAQEAFVRAYRSLGRFDVEQPFRPWLLRIVTNTALNLARAAGRRRAAGERYQRTVGPSAHAESPEATAESAELARRVWDAVSSLEAQDQEVVYLRYFLDASEQETAMAIGRPVGTVKSRLHRALRRLRSLVEEHYPDLAPQHTGTKA